MIERWVVSGARQAQHSAGCTTQDGTAQQIMAPVSGRAGEKDSQRTAERQIGGSRQAAGAGGSDSWQVGLEVSATFCSIGWSLPIWAATAIYTGHALRPHFAGGPRTRLVDMRKIQRE